MSIDRELRKTADEIRQAASRSALPDDVRWPNRATGLGARVAAVAIVLVGGVGALMLTTNDDSGESPVPADSVGRARVQRFTVNGMRVDAVTESADGESSTILLNTETPEPNSSLPAVQIFTGNQPAADLSGWDRTGNTVEVLDRTVEVWTLDGDPLGIMWTTRSGEPVTLVGEGFDDVEAFKAMLTRVEPLPTDEWKSLSTESTSGRGVPRGEAVPDTNG